LHLIANFSSFDDHTLHIMITDANNTRFRPPRFAHTDHVRNDDINFF